MNFPIESLVVGFFGIAIGCFLTLILFSVALRYEKRRDNRRRALELKVKEIGTLQLLNKKIHNILQKRTIVKPNFFSFDAFDDILITFDDYAYLQSFVAQNNFYLPSYIMEEFFKKISHRRVALPPEENLKLDGYTFKEGCEVLEKFAEDIGKLIEERKLQLKELANRPIHLILKEEISYNYNM